jgi:hypothetical protein
VFLVTISVFEGFLIGMFLYLYLVSFNLVDEFFIKLLLPRLDETSTGATGSDMRGVHRVRRRIHLVISRFFKVISFGMISASTHSFVADFTTTSKNYAVCGD